MYYLLLLPLLLFCFCNLNEASERDCCPSFGAGPQESRGRLSRASFVDPGS